MQATLVTIPAHFDGQSIQLDADITLKPNTRLLVTVLGEDNSHRSLVREAMQSIAKLAGKHLGQRG